MTDDSMPQSTTSQVQEWCSDWADQFDQDWSTEALAEWLGKTIHAYTPPGVEPPRSVVATVVGYSIDTIFIEDRAVCRYSFITDGGLQIPLFDKMQVEESEE